MAFAQSLSSIVDTFRREVDGLRVYELTATLSRLHRIQGSEDIVVAAEHLKMVLDEAGIESSLHVRRGTVGLWRRWALWEPRGWSLGGGVRVERRRSDGGWEDVASTRDHPLVAVAHGPPGSVEARPVLLGREPAKRLGDERAVILPSFSPTDYHDLEAKGVELVIASHRGPGIRYYGLFPPPFTREPRALAVSLPLQKALRLDGEVVRVVSETEYRDTVTPILHARVGNGPLSIVVVAHICHPTPGAHDNASGAAVVVEVLRALKQHEEVLSKAGLRVDALLVPEHTGTALAFDEGLVEADQAIAAVSVDMVGSNLSITGGSLNLYTSPLALPSPLDPLLYRSLWLVFAEASAFDYGRYPTIGLYPMMYSRGSDHDITASMGIPSSLLNEWPDKYYHTSLDTPEKLSPQSLAKTAVAVASAIAGIAILGPDRLIEILEHWLHQQHNSLLLDKSLGLVSQGRMEAYQRITEKGLCTTRARIEAAMGKRSDRTCWEPEIEPRIRGPLSTRYLRLLGGEAGKRLLEIREDAEIVRGLAPIVLSATGSRRAVLLEAYAARGRRIEAGIVEDIVAVMTGAGGS